MKQCWQSYVTPWNFHEHKTFQQSWALETPWYPCVCGWSMNLHPIARRWQYLDHHSQQYDSFIIVDYDYISTHWLTSNLFLSVRLSPTKNPSHSPRLDLSPNMPIYAGRVTDQVIVWSTQNRIGTEENGHQEKLKMIYFILLFAMIWLFAIVVFLIFHQWCDDVYFVLKGWCLLNHWTPHI